MMISLEKLEILGACSDAFMLFQENQKDPIDAIELLTKMVDARTRVHKCIKEISQVPYIWANWLTTQCLNTPDKIRYALHAARVAFPIYNIAYPLDDRVLKAIKYTENYLECHSVTENVDIIALHARQSLRDACRQGKLDAFHAACSAEAVVCSTVSSGCAEYAILYAAKAYGVQNPKTEEITLRNLLSYGIALLKTKGCREC